MTYIDDDTKKAILYLLKELGESSTAELIDEATKLSSSCKDRVLSILITLEKENRVIKKISNEKLLFGN